MTLRRFLRYRVFSLPILLVAITALSSACMWGVARDADTGQPLVSAKVTLTDSQGQTLVATTDERGIFGFGPPSGAAPALGEARIRVEAPGYGTIDEVRQMSYNDNPNASFADPSSFWEVQAFELRQGTGAYFHSADGHFSMTFPTGWTTVSLDPLPGVAATAPANSSDAPATCVVLWMPLNGETLNAIVDSYLTYLEKDETISHIERFGTTDVQVNGLPAVNSVFSYRQESNNGNQMMQLTLKNLMYAIAVGSDAYVIDCMTFIEKYQDTVPTFEKIVKSFTPDK